ncbi:DUF1963 domain-containing protein [Nonomuraea sp. NPDC049750]|uniref:DUF1963 domain-containing protein n=1 Tax=Nonomuraea sp. NPDC049750 TaxID=3154738 RepID=UPI00340AD146
MPRLIAAGVDCDSPKTTIRHHRSCEAPLTFFVQIDLSRTPKAAREAFGLGLLQLFPCTTCNPYHPFSSGDLVRIVDPAGAVTPVKEPEGARVLPVRPIIGWGRAAKDYPYREADEPALLPDEREVVFTLNRQGDKLGGWPSWAQDPDYPRCPHGDHRMTQPILQIDSNHGVAHTWGDNGALNQGKQPLSPNDRQDRLGTIGVRRRIESALWA